MNEKVNERKTARDLDPKHDILKPEKNKNKKQKAKIQIQIQLK